MNKVIPIYFSIIFFKLVISQIDDKCYTTSQLYFPKVMDTFTFCGIPSSYKETFSIMDKDKNGKVDIIEFARYCFNPFQTYLFCLYDRDKDGKVNLLEFRWGEFYKFRISGIMKLIDKNDNNLIDGWEMRRGFQIFGISDTSLTDWAIKNKTDLKTGIIVDDFIEILNRSPSADFPCAFGSRCGVGNGYINDFNEIDANLDHNLDFDELSKSNFTAKLLINSFRVFNSNEDDGIDRSEWEAVLDPKYEAYQFKNSIFSVSLKFVH